MSLLFSLYLCAARSCLDLTVWHEKFTRRPNLHRFYRKATKKKIIKKIMSGGFYIFVSLTV